MIRATGLPGSPPDFNPIEQVFAELKALIKRNWKISEDNSSQSFGRFLKCCVNIVAAREKAPETIFDTQA